MKIEYYKKENFLTSFWKGGTTTELLILPNSSSYQKRDFAIRLSSATVEIPFSNFTHLPKIKRFITPISNALLLEIDGKERFLLPFEWCEFLGDQKTNSYGIVRDFNLMLDETKANGWAKTLKALEETKIEVKKDMFIYFFSPYNNVEIMLNDRVYYIEEYSLLIVKDIEKREILIKNESVHNIIFGVAWRLLN